MSLVENFEAINETIPKYVKLVSVSKTKPSTDIMELYEHGVRIFGENKVQELVQKYEELPKDIEWHHIGHLQSNKVKYIAPFVSLIHAVDSFKLLRAINKEGKKVGRKIPVLMQIHIASEETKFGLLCSELKSILESSDFVSLENIEIFGLMGMATNTDDEVQIRKEFESLKECFIELKELYFSASTHFTQISMGMSGDYKIAIEEGSTIVRVGSRIFGKRNYTK